MLLIAQKLTLELLLIVRAEGVEVSAHARVIALVVELKLKLNQYCNMCSYCCGVCIVL